MALSQGKEGSATEIEELERELENRLSQVDEELAFIKMINADISLPESGHRRLEEIHRKRYVDLEGQERPYLTHLEFENLSVRRGNLTEGEIEEIRSHVNHTENIVNKIPFTRHLKRVPVFVIGHHEMLDGSGYPRHVKAEDIPLQSRIIAVADIFEALTAGDRPYKNSIDPINSLAILQEEAKNGRLDKELVRIFIEKRVYEAGEKTT